MNGRTRSRLSGIFQSRTVHVKPSAQGLAQSRTNVTNNLHPPSMGAAQRLCPQSSLRHTFLASTEAAVCSWPWPPPFAARWTAFPLQTPLAPLQQVNPQVVKLDLCSHSPFSSFSSHPPQEVWHLTPALSLLSALSGTAPLSHEITVQYPFFIGASIVCEKNLCFRRRQRVASKIAHEDYSES